MQDCSLLTQVDEVEADSMKQEQNSGEKVNTMEIKIIRGSIMAVLHFHHFCTLHTKDQTFFVY